MNKVEFFCELKQLKVDKEKHATLTLDIDSTQAKKIMDFYADNTEILISAAFVTVPDKEYTPVEENITTGEIKDKEGG
jgi:hypothetical protein